MPPADAEPATGGLPGGTGRARRLLALAQRRRGVLGVVLLLPTWVLVGVALVAYVLGMLAVAVLAVVVATLRLFLTPPLSALARARRGAPGA